MAVYCTKSKWNSQQIKKQCKNKHHNAFDDINWSTNVNASISFQNYCNEYHKNIYTKYDKNEDEIYIDEYDEYIPNYWRCSQCTFDNIERDLYCSICKSPFKSIHNTTKYITTFGDHLPSVLDDIIKTEDDTDEAIQIAIIYSYHDITQSTQTQIYQKPNTKYTKRKQKTKEERERERIKNKRRERLQKRRRLKNEKKRIKKEKQQQQIKSITKCCRECPKISSVIGDNIIDFIRKNIEKYYYNNNSYNIELVLNYNVLIRFLSCNDEENKWEFVYHGTNHENNEGIIRNGLIVGGTKGVKIRNGSCYGRGVYCSPNTCTAKGYERGSMFVCIVRYKKVQINGGIWVVPNSDDILPLYLVSFGNRTQQNGAKPTFPYFPISAALQSIISPTVSININNDGLNQQLMRFIPSFKSFNAKKRFKS